MSGTTDSGWYGDERENQWVPPGKNRQEILDRRYQWTPGCHLCDAEKADSNRRYSSAVDSYDDCYHARHRRWTHERIAPWASESRIRIEEHEENRWLRKSHHDQPLMSRISAWGLDASDWGRSGLSEEDINEAKEARGRLLKIIAYAERPEDFPDHNDIQGYRGWEAGQTSEAYRDGRAVLCGHGRITVKGER